MKVLPGTEYNIMCQNLSLEPVYRKGLITQIVASVLRIKIKSLVKTNTLANHSLCNCLLNV